MNILKIIIPAATVLILNACSHDKVERVNFDDFKGSPDPSVFQATKVTSDNLDTDIDCPLPFGGTLSEIEGAQPSGPQTKTTSITAIGLVRELLDNNMCNRVHSVAGTYMSVDQDGKPVQLSGKIILPITKEIKNIIVVSHFTVGANFECPSESFQLEGMLAGLGYAMIFPDYLGFGVSKDRVHPYLVADVTARNVVDMLRACIPYLKQIGKAPKSDEIFLMGYSQGGATTIAVQRYLETRCYGEFKIRRVFAGGGPYDIAATYDKLIELDRTSIPYCVPMIIQGMNEGHRLGLDYKDFFAGPMLDHYDEWLNSKKYTLKQISNLVGSDRMSEVLTEDGRQKRSPGTLELYRAMLLNSVDEDWAPIAPVYMFHSQDDSFVPFLNSQNARNLFHESNIEYNFGHYGDHQMGAVRFIFTVQTLLKKEK